MKLNKGHIHIQGNVFEINLKPGAKVIKTHASARTHKSVLCSHAAQFVKS